MASDEDRFFFYIMHEFCLIIQCCSFSFKYLEVRIKSFYRFSAKYFWVSLIKSGLFYYLCYLNLFSSQKSCPFQVFDGCKGKNLFYPKLRFGLIMPRCFYDWSSIRLEYFEKKICLLLIFFESILPYTLISWNLLQIMVFVVD